GKIAQIGYVVRDIDAAMDNWLKHGVGPWFYVDRVQTSAGVIFARSRVEEAGKKQERG
ncbi:MAG: hypothetical protein QOE20_4000, partial [Mycobacterium sp.]|nr:hypothetical protein [Mycobacterium sp.]